MLKIQILNPRRLNGKIGIAAVLLLTVWSGRAELPPPFRLMADHSDQLKTSIPLTSGIFANYRPATMEIERGFWLAATDAEINFTEASRIETPFINRDIKAVVCPGEYVSRAMLLTAEKPLKNLKYTVCSLQSSAGQVIPAENLDLRMVIPAAVNPGLTGNMMVKPELPNMAAGQCVWLWLMLYAPENARPGLYKGSIEFRDEQGKTLTTAVHLRVLDFRLPALKSNAGFYLPGHFYYPDKEQRFKDFKCPTRCNYTCWAFPGYNAANIDNYFRFWKTRKLNSPEFYHNYYDFEQDSGGNPIISGYSDTTRLIEAYRRAQLDGIWCLDQRFLAEWAFMPRTKEEVEEVKKDLNYVSPAGKKRLGETLAELIKIAQKENWPPYLLFTAEEISNTKEGAAKFDGYIRQLIGKISPDPLMVVDNDIGYGRQDAIDRGKLYGIKHRQYASWTPEAVNDAAKDQAEVWTYNHGPFRASFGLFQMRINSHGHHQWADQWHGLPGKASYAGTNYAYSFITPDGKIISSAEYERIQEGRTDLGFCQKLQELIASQPDRPASRQAAAVLQSVYSDIPVQKGAFVDWMYNYSSQDMDLRRWQLALAIMKFSHPLLQPSVQAAPGQPQAYIAAVENREKSIPALLLKVRKNDADFNLDGKREEAAWGNGTGALKFMLSKENAIIAMGSTESEIKRMLIPSYVEAWVSYNRQGLCLFFKSNQAWFDRFMTRRDNDAELWRDNCMDCMFKIPGQNATYQFIINPKGAKVLVKSGQVIAAAGTGIKVKSLRLSDNGDYQQEVLIPWNLFGLRYLPEKGTVWRANIGRANYALGEQYVSWGRVNVSFGEQDRWGTLIFSGSGTNQYLDSLDYATGLPGQNRIGGILKSPRSHTVTLVDERNKPVLRETVAPGSFNLTYAVPPAGGVRNWTLRLLDDHGKIIETAEIPVFGPEHVLQLEPVNQSVVSGDIIKFKAEIMLGALTARETGLAIQAQNMKTGTVYRIGTLPLPHSGPCLIWIDTAGMAPGMWTLRFSLTGKLEFPVTQAQNITILPSPFVE